MVVAASTGERGRCLPWGLERRAGFAFGCCSLVDLAVLLEVEIRGPDIMAPAGFAIDTEEAAVLSGFPLICGNRFP